jgi:hypothetical protein
MNRYLLITGLLACASLATHAQSSAPKVCPWVTQGSAAKALGGEVSATIEVSESGEGSCSFNRITDASTSLRIAVSKSALPSCGADGMALKGIGDEAARCTIPGSDSGSDNPKAEMISGRVRDMHFTVTLRANEHQSPGRPADPQDDELEHIAEAVAGNLF